MRLLMSILVVFISISLFSQSDSVNLHVNLPTMYADKDFFRKYKSELKKMRRVYPMALKAKELIDAYEEDLAVIDKKRTVKKYSKNAHEELKEQFTYSIKDLYVSEGQLLMELVHRETGMTVNEIIRKYRGAFQAGVYDAMSLLFDQNLDAKYDKDGKNWINEIIIYDIEHNNLEFEKEFKPMSKLEYKTEMKDYRNEFREYKNLLKERRRKEKRLKKEEKKKSRS